MKLMRIEVRSPLSYTPEEMILVDTQKTDSPPLAGLRVGWNVYINRDLNPYDWITTFTHEVGHLIGDTISFQDGSVLSPLEVQGTNICLSHDEQDLLSQVFGGSKRRILTEISDSDLEILTEIGRKLILAFVLNKEHGLENLVLHSLGSDQLVEVARTVNLVTAEVKSDGKIVSKSDKFGRDLELPSCLTEYACTQILENTLVRYRIISGRTQLVVAYQGLPHQRAQNIIARAFRYNYRLPSLLDLDS